VQGGFGEVSILEVSRRLCYGDDLKVSQLGGQEGEGASLPGGGERDTNRLVSNVW
jgi:hypothetical protein